MDPTGFTGHEYRMNFELEKWIRRVTLQLYCSSRNIFGGSGSSSLTPAASFGINLSRRAPLRTCSDTRSSLRWRSPPGWRHRMMPRPRYRLLSKDRGRVNSPPLPPYLPDDPCRAVRAHRAPTLLPMQSRSPLSAPWGAGASKSYTRSLSSSRTRTSWPRLRSACPMPSQPPYLRTACSATSQP
eukprot:COSAG03_NODE_225_length_10336_cov_715.603888_15_plen_184_part_00